MRVDVARTGNRHAPTPNSGRLSGPTIQSPILSSSVLRLTSPSHLSTLLIHRDWKQNRSDVPTRCIHLSTGQKRIKDRQPPSHRAQSRSTRSTANDTTAASASRTPSAQSTMMDSIRSGISSLIWGPQREKDVADAATSPISEGTEERRK